LFNLSIETSGKSDDLTKRLDILQEHFTYSLYKNVCRSLFEKDKLLFSFLLCINLLQNHGKIISAEWMFLLTGGVGLDNPHKNPASWIPVTAWDQLCRLNDLGIDVPNPDAGFEKLRGSIESNVTGWKKVYDSLTPQDEAFPAPFDKVSTFHRMCILRCLRGDKIVPAITSFVSSQMTPAFVEPPSFNLGACYSDSFATQPLIFVLSPGSDPTGALLKFADDQVSHASLSRDSLALVSRWPSFSFVRSTC
jgi:dynein heavy chain